jgi:UDP-N-acetylmuramoyl-L-alanyl-D-glutamate--2,6-diaminopimelate ligase
MRDAGVDTMLIEVSSHAIVQRRCDSVEFDVAAFTNLGRDHLDYHGTIEEYTDVKKRLFNELLSANENARGAVVNVDDPVGEEIAAEHRGRVLRYGTSGRALDLYAEEVREDIDGISATVVSDWGRAPVRTSLAGEHNLRNILAALGCGLLLDMPLDSLVDGIAAIASVPGRLERVGETEEFCVFVDYAHTHDALEAVLQSLRPLTRGRLITVFGCGGDRDTSKRALMGEVAARYSDVLIVTSDNPRSENPLAIIHDVEAGLTEISPFGEHNERGYILEVDRADAIRRAVGIARGGDVVLIAGKGHETYQEIGSERLPFDDRAIAGAAIVEAKEGRR